MKHRINFAICITLLCLFNTALSQELKKILVIEADTLKGASRDNALILSTELYKAVSRVGNYDVIIKSSEELKKAFIEHNKPIPAIQDKSSMKDLGTWYRTDFVIGGTIGRTENKQFVISLELIDTKQGNIISTAQLNVMDFNHKLILDRFSKLLLYGRLRITCNLTPYEFFLDGSVVSNESRDPDYNCWLIEPGKTHIIEIRTEKENYTTYKENLTFNIAESRVVNANLKSLIGILQVTSKPEAEVYLNDEFIGTTKLQRQIKAGEYSLALKAGRHDDISRSVTISPEDTTFVFETLPVDYSSYRRNGIISAAAAVLFVGGALYASSEANKAYDRYLVTMDAKEMSNNRDKAKTLDVVSYVSYGLAGAFTIWSILEWVGLINSHESSEVGSAMNDFNRFNFSFTNKSVSIRLQIF